MAEFHNLSGKRVLITGAARGIGAESAKRLAARGARVAAVGLEPELLERTAVACGNDSIWVEADVSDRDSIEEATSEVAERLGGIDVLVSNAGIAGAGTVRTIDPDVFDRTIEVNLLGTWRANRAALPHIIESRGYILNIASVAAILPGPLMSAYAASKAGAEAFSDSLRIEVAHLGVNVGVAYFLWIDTDMVRDGDAIPAFAKFRKSLRGPAGKTLPLSAAIDAIEQGVAERRQKIFAPGSVSLIARLRGIKGLFDRDAKKVAPELVRLAEQHVADEGAAQASMSERTRAVDPVIHS